MTKHEAFVRILQDMRISGYNSGIIATALLHLDTHTPTDQRVSLLARGFTIENTENQINAAEDDSIEETHTELAVHPEDSESHTR